MQLVLESVTMTMISSLVQQRCEQKPKFSLIIIRLSIRFNLDSFVSMFCNYVKLLYYPSATRRHGNFAGVHTLLRILLSSNSALLINIITGDSPPHFDFVVYYVLCQC
jgi:hypothetical protein